MIPRHQEVDPPVAHQVDHSMFLRDAARPAALHVEAQGLGLADPLQRIAQHVLDELEDTHRDDTVAGYPVREVFTELGMEDREALRSAPIRLFRLQGRDCGAVR